MTKQMFCYLKKKKNTPITMDMLKSTFQNDGMVFFNNCPYWVLFDQKIQSIKLGILIVLKRRLG
jgi:hypothetical protein